MPTLTVYADTSDQFIQSDGTTLNNAYDGVDSVVPQGASHGDNELGMYYGGTNGQVAEESFLSFDTSTVPSTATITSETFSVVKRYTNVLNGVAEIRSFDWGTSVSAADWRTRAQLDALTLLASKDPDAVAEDARFDFTFSASGVVKAGSTRVVMNSANARTGSATQGQLKFYSADSTGTTNDPRLIVVYSSLYTKALTGASTPAGVVVRQTQKGMGGGVGSAGSSVGITSRFRAFTGAITIAGVLASVKQAVRALTGAVTSAGVLAGAKRAVRALTGAAASAGVLAGAKRAVRALTGAVTSAGVLVRLTLDVLSGAVTSAGALLQRSTRTLAGAVASVGALVRLAVRALAGAVSSSGVLARAKITARSLSGSVSSAGTLVRRTLDVLSGAVSSAGTLARSVSKSFTGAVSSIGALVRRAGRSLSGAVSSAGFLPDMKVLFPNSDISAGTWTTNAASHFAGLADEDDATHSTSALSPVDDTLVVGLQSSGIPPAGPVSIIVRARMV